jgi:hypothetical protein
VGIGRQITRSKTYTVQNIFDRLIKGENLWASFERKGKSIESAKKQLCELMEQYHEKEAKKK